jgi:hypothetical protein
MASKQVNRRRRAAVEACDYTLPSWLSNSDCDTFGATIRINAKFKAAAEVFGLGCQRRR